MSPAMIAALSIPAAPALPGATPDFAALVRVLRREDRPRRLPFYELFSNLEVPVLRHLGMDPGKPPTTTDPERHLDWIMRNKIQYQLALGYDYIDVWGWALGFSFGGAKRATAATTEGQRGYVMSHDRVITSREDFARYVSPDPAALQLDRLDRWGSWLPEGMRIIAKSRGVLETTMDLLGHEDICYLLHDDIGLVREVFARVGASYLAGIERLAAHPAVGAITFCDDMGFKTQTLLSPATYREMLFPWHERIVAAVHRQGKPAILHACGNLGAVMEDIIACGWDAKQSFEDCIQPIWEAQERYGDRICLLGGFDVDKLSRMSVREVRAHVGLLKSRCGGRPWALGTGNSVPNYVPVENLLAMLDEGRRD